MTITDLKKLHLNIKIRMLVSFITDIAEMSMFPFMAIYFSTHLGTAQAGIILTFTTILTILSGIIGGHFADVLGRKK